MLIHSNLRVVKATTAGPRGAMGVAVGGVAVLSGCGRPSSATAQPLRRRCLQSPQQISSSNFRRQELSYPNPICPEAHRRTALLLLSAPPALVALLSIPHRATAFSIGISGPKEWLREQKKKAARFVLAPIDASRQSLRNAYILLTSESPVEDGVELQKLLNSAARDCIPQDRSPFVTFQATAGVEVCTFRLIVKNAASLLDDGDPVKLEAENRLDQLIRSLAFLGGAIDSSDLQLTSDREKVKISLMESISALDKFEEGINDCLGV